MARTPTFLIAVLCVVALAGCTITPSIPPVRVPSPTTSRVSVSSPTPTPTRTYTLTPPPTILPPVSTFALVCTPPQDGIVEWIEGNSDPRVSAKKVIMVHVGFGLDSDSDWWIVGAYLPGYDEIWTWLTQRPMIGPGAPWIIVSEGTMKTWGGVSWKDDRLVRGLKAQDTAITCLGGKPLSSGRY